jgi:hypothetical protein
MTDSKRLDNKINKRNSMLLSSMIHTQILIPKIKEIRTLITIIKIKKMCKINKKTQKIKTKDP